MLTPANRVEVTFSIPRNQVAELVRVVFEEFDILPARLDTPEPPYPDKRIFISYRRIDSEDICGRLYDRLVAAFGKGNVFRDVGGIPAGADFKQIITREVSACNVMLVLMGMHWDDAENLRRLQHENDFVRLEIESALQRNITVVPVWVSRRSSMPNQTELPEPIQSLCYRDARQVRSDPDFHTDVDRLITDIKTIFDLQDELTNP